MKLKDYFIITDDGLDIDKQQIFCIKEFEDLHALERNKTEYDPEGKNRYRFKKELKYIYVRYDWDSYAHEYSESDKEDCAITDSGLTKEELKDPVFKAAIEKYIKEQKDCDLDLLNSAINLCHKTRQYFDNVDYTLRDLEKGFPLYNAKDVLATMKALPDALSSLEELRERVIKKKEEESSLRGGTKIGHFD